MVSPSVCADRHVRQHHAFAVEEVQLEARALVGLARHRRRRHRRPSGRCDVAFSCAMIQASCAASCRYGCARAAASDRVAAHVLGVEARVDDADDGLAARAGRRGRGRNVELFHHGQPSTTPTHDFWGMRIAVTCRDRFCDRRKQLVGHGGAARVHEHDAVLADGRHDVAAAAPTAARCCPSPAGCARRCLRRSAGCWARGLRLRRERGHDNEHEHERSASQSHPNLNLIQRPMDALRSPAVHVLSLSVCSYSG